MVPTRLSEGTVKEIHRTLAERFGEAIGDAEDVGPGVADERSGHPEKGPDSGNFGWGSGLQESAVTCQSCGGMMGMDESVCSECGMMGGMDESQVSGRHPGHATSCTCPDCSRPEYTDKLGERDER